MTKQKKPTPTGGREKINREDVESPSSREELALTSESMAETQEKRGELQSEEMRQIREKLEKTDLDDALKNQAAAKAETIKALAEEKKIKELLILAKTKGVIYAVHVAKKMDDHYILDLLHDMLAKEGYYKNFLKKV